MIARSDTQSRRQEEQGRHEDLNVFNLISCNCNVMVINIDRLLNYFCSLGKRT